MKIAIGYKLQEGPWGGGNRFATNLTDFLITRGHEVVFNLNNNDIDVIVLTDPRSRAPTISFGAGAVLRYLTGRNSNAIVVHRINECDERKNTRTMNRRLRQANYCADHTVLIASWLKDLALWNGGRNSVILNGADGAIFHARGHKPWNGKEPLRIITHHWGGNWMKGFDVYQMLDAMLEQEKWKGRIEFTYIGNLPEGFQFRNTRHVKPLHGDALASELRAHHIYLTATINEPAGMHHIEGACCGLPLLYRDSGALPEYCNGYGECFAGPEDFTETLVRIMISHDLWGSKIPLYPNNADKMCLAYALLFEELVAHRHDIVGSRRLFRSPYLFLRNQIAI